MPFKDDKREWEPLGDKERAESEDAEFPKLPPFVPPMPSLRTEPDEDKPMVVEFSEMLAKVGAPRRGLDAVCGRGGGPLPRRVPRGGGIGTPTLAVDGLSEPSDKKAGRFGGIGPSAPSNDKEMA